MTLSEELPEVIELNKQLAALNQDIEKAGEDSNVEKAHQLHLQLENLKRRKAEIQAKQANNPDTDLRICEVTGAFTSLRDPEERRQAFVQGKLYQGWVTAREKLKEFNRMFGEGE
eukprot:RCo012321